MSDLKEQLDHFVGTDGWRWFVAKVEDEWGAQGKRYLAELDRALNLTDNDAAASQARQIRSGQKIIQSLLRLPFEELRRLQSPSEPDAPPNRAPLDPELVGQSRRGSGL